MPVQRAVIGEGEQRTPGPGAPVAEVLLGADSGPMAVLAVTVPPGGAMPSHDHGASAVVLIPLIGSIRVESESGGPAIELASDTVGAIAAGERVRLENPGDLEAQLLVVLTPPDFADSVKAWPGVV